MHHHPAKGLVQNHYCGPFLSWAPSRPGVLNAPPPCKRTRAEPLWSIYILPCRPRPNPNLTPTPTQTLTFRRARGRHGAVGRAAQGPTWPIRLLKVLHELYCRVVLQLGTLIAPSPLTWPQNDESWVLLMRCASFLQSRMSVYLPPPLTSGAAVSRAALGSTHLDQNCVHASLPCGTRAYVVCNTCGPVRGHASTGGAEANGFMAALWLGSYQLRNGVSTRWIGHDLGSTIDHLAPNLPL